MPSPTIQTSSLTRRFGENIGVDQLSLEVQAGSELPGQYAHIAAQIEPQDERMLEP